MKPTLVNPERKLYRIILFFHHLFNLGTQPVNGMARNRQIKVVNIAGITGGTISVIFCMVNATAGNYLLSVINICTAACLFAMVFFNSKGRYELGPLITMPLCSVQLAVSTMLYNNNMDLYLLLIICLALVLLNNRRVMLLLIVFDVILFLVAHKLQTITVQHPASEGRRFINIVVWLFLLLGCLYFYRLQIMNYMKELEAKNNQLSSLNKTKEKLISVIAHDMRSPIATLGATLSLLNENLLSEKEFADFAKGLAAQLKVLQENMDGLLNWCYSQMKGIAPHPVSFDVVALAQEVAVFLQPQMKQKNITLENRIAESPLLVEADSEHVRLIIRNLLSNAIKFSHPGSAITLSLQQTAGIVQVGVHDNGVGMSTATREKLFASANIYPAAGTQNEKGVGLGLSLSQEFAQKNKGFITVQSELGKGSSFCLHLNTSMPAFS